MKQKGFTLIELLVALPIGVVVLAVIVSSIFQILQGRVDIAQKSIAMADIDNAVHWLTRDLILAQKVIDPRSGEPLPEGITTENITMNWSDLTAWAGDEGFVEHSASYALSGTQLLRDYDGEWTIVGKHLTNVGFSIKGKMFTVTLTSRPGLSGSTVTRSFSIEMRSDLGP